jgi:CHAT domain-containing protein
MGMRLDADLVVLSACRTAQGETTGGDEVLGLTRGLLAAGARAAVVSLWPVNDFATSLLMGQFYRRLQAGDDPARALQATQNYLRQMTPDQIRAELGELSMALHSAGVRDAVVMSVDAECALRDPRRPNLKARPTDYNHPCYWAPFVVVGA